MLLRLTRWLSLCQKMHAPGTGRAQGNIYILHNEVLPLLAVIGWGNSNYTKDRVNLENRQETRGRG